MGQYCFARIRLPALSVVVCNTRGQSAAAGPGMWLVRRPTLPAGQYGYVSLGRHRVLYFSVFLLINILIF